MKEQLTLITGKLLIDGNGGSPLENGAILIKGDVIEQVGSVDSIKLSPNANVKKINYKDKTLLPGLIDGHVHLNGFGDGRSGNDLALLPDEILTLQSAKNAQTHLYSGVTTVRDLGAKNRTSFLLREAINMGITVGPRLVLCGRPMAIVGGHFSYFGIEATGIVECIREVRQNIKEGADCIKITATGGSTKTSFPFRPSFNVDEMKAIVNEAHKFGKHTAAHCVSLQGIKNALDAGIDTLIHCVFLDAEGAAAPDLDVVKRIAEQGIYVNPTLSQSLVSIKNLEEKSELTPEEQKLLNQMKGKKGTNHRQPRIDETKKMVEMGVKLIAGSDASWQYYPMGGFQYELESFVYEVGLTPMEAIVSATRDCARSLWIDKEIGTLEKGKKADILIVDGDPSKDIKKLWNIEEVFLGGNPVLPTDNTIR